MQTFLSHSPSSDFRLKLVAAKGARDHGLTGCSSRAKICNLVGPGIVKFLVKGLFYMGLGPFQKLAGDDQLLDF